MNIPKLHKLAVFVRKPLLLVVTATASIIVLASCETMSQADQGEIIGGVVGGVVGAQIGEGHGRTAAIIIGMGPVIVEGPFARNNAYLRMLGVASSSTVIPTGSATGTSQGAASRR